MAKAPAPSRKRSGGAAGRRAAKTSATRNEAADDVRLHVLIARSGLASRREAERLIAAGEVTVNGTVVTEAGSRAKFDDHIKVSGRRIEAPRFHEYFAYHKPAGMVTTMRDPEGRPSLGDVVESLGVRVLPVGRLDYDSSGLLLLTNDGELTHRLTHPRYGVEKRYHVKIDRPAPRAGIERLRTGVELDDGLTAPAFVGAVRGAPSRSWLEIRIHEGRTRQLRRMCEAIGRRVVKLKRVAVGPIRLGRLEVGTARRLTAREVAALERAVEEPATATPPRRRRGKS